MTTKKYISTDVETSGRTPGKYSMLSLGSCVVFDRDTTFYRELKPISPNFDLEAVRVGCSGLICLRGLKDEELNPKSDKFNPKKVLELLSSVGEEPKKVMKDYADWVLKVTKGYKAVEAAAPSRFDGMFSAWYFDNFYNGEDPFGHSGEDINSVYRGVMGDTSVNITNLGIRSKGLNHNALDDAIKQAEELEEVLRVMKVK